MDDGIDQYLGVSAHYLDRFAGRRVYMLVRAADVAESVSRYLIQRIIGNASIELLCNSELIGLDDESDLEEVSWIDKQTGQMGSPAARGCGFAAASTSR